MTSSEFENAIQNAATRVTGSKTARRNFENRGISGISEKNEKEMSCVSDKNKEDNMKGIKEQYEQKENRNDQRGKNDKNDKNDRGKRKAEDGSVSEDYPSTLSSLSPTKLRKVKSKGK